jgi:hypothetical protein
MTDLKEERKTRTQESRAAESVHEEYSDNWEHKGLLDTTNIPAKQGFVQRWVRTLDKSGNADKNNVFKKVNQGWRVRLKSDVEKGLYIPNIDFEGQDVIGIHGMILMERPEKQHLSHQRHLRQESDRQMQGVKQNLFNAHQQGSGFVQPGMTSKTMVSKGRQAQADDD